MSHVRCALSRVPYLSEGSWCLQWAANPSSRSRRKGGHTSPTSQEQWAVFSWITVASSPLRSHWSAEPHHSSRQEAVTSGTKFFNQSGGQHAEVTHFQSHFLWVIHCSDLLAQKKRDPVISDPVIYTHPEKWARDCLCYHESVAQVEIWPLWPTMTDENDLQLRKPCISRQSSVLWYCLMYDKLLFKRFNPRTTKLNWTEYTERTKVGVTRFSFQQSTTTRSDTAWFVS